MSTSSPMSPPTAPNHWRFWLIAGVVTLVLIYLLRGVLLPFVAGAAAAYFLDPVADWLERRGLNRSMATVAITVLFLLLSVLALLILVPAVQGQISNFLSRMPEYAAALEGRLRPVIAQAHQFLPPDQVESLKAEAASMIGKLGSWAIGVVQGVLTGGLALINIVSLLVITPVVTFYLLRDWDRMVNTIDGWLPRAQADVIRDQVRKIDTMLAGFVRGQATVCLVLGVFYAVGLGLIGLDLGLVVGLAAGLLSFIPYVGSVGGFLVSMGLAFAQFSDPMLIGATAAIFLVGQFLEGNFLSPWLVGGRVGLHPVWIIFALLAGVALFGFLGLLLAVPVAAAIGVLARFFLERYLNSDYFGRPTPSPADTPDGDDA